MTRFVNINGYTINPDHVMRIQQCVGDILDEETKFKLYLCDGSCLDIHVSKDVKKEDIVDHLTGAETYCF